MDPQNTQLSPSILRWTSVSDFLRNKQDAFLILVHLEEYKYGQYFYATDIFKKFPGISRRKICQILAEGIRIGMLGYDVEKKSAWKYYRVEPPTVRKISDERG